MSGELAKALIAARQACQATVYKAGANEAQRYKFVGHEHVLGGGARTALLANGLVLEQVKVEYIGQERYQTRNGENTVWRWRGVHKLLHTSGEERTYEYEATTVPNDKAAFVASTALDRTAHMRVLELAGSAEENPEHDSHEQAARALRREELAQRREQRQATRAQSRPDHDPETGEVRKPARTQSADKPITAPTCTCPTFGPRATTALRGKRWDVHEGAWQVQQWWENPEARAQFSPEMAEWAQYIVAQRARRKAAEDAAKRSSRVEREPSSDDLDDAAMEDARLRAEQDEAERALGGAP